MTAILACFCCIDICFSFAESRERSPFTCSIRSTVGCTSGSARMSLPPSLPAKSRCGVSTMDSWIAEKHGKWSTNGRNVTRPLTNRLISEICAEEIGEQNVHVSFKIILLAGKGKGKEQNSIQEAGKNAVRS